MNIEGFLTEIKTDPLARNYAAMTRDELWTSLHTANRTIIDPNTPSVAELGVLKAFGAATGDPNNGNVCLDKLEAAANSNGTLKRVLDWIKPGAPGLDLSDSLIRATIDSLVAATVITSDEGNILKAIAEKTVSRLAEIHDGNEGGYSDLTREYFEELLTTNNLLMPS